MYTPGCSGSRAICSLRSWMAIRYYVAFSCRAQRIETTADRMTFTGAIGAACMYPLRALIRLCVSLRIHPNTLTLIGYLINVAAAFALGYGQFRSAFVIILIANIFDMIDGKV